MKYLRAPFAIAAMAGSLQSGLFSLAAQQTNETGQLPPVTVEGVAVGPDSPGRQQRHHGDRRR